MAPSPNGVETAAMVESSGIIPRRSTARGASAACSSAMKRRFCSIVPTETRIHSGSL